MKSNRVFKNVILISFAALILSATVYSQTGMTADSLLVGKTYKFVLFDDSDIIGKVLYADSIKIKVVDVHKNVFFILWDRVLYYSTSSTPSKYLFSLSLMGGVSLCTNHDDYHYYSNGMQSGLNIDLAGILYISDTKGIKIDASYSFLKAKYEENVIPAIYPYYPNIYEGGDVSNYLIKGNFLFGSFKPGNKFIGYGSLGLGFHVTNQQELREQYYSSYDSAYITRIYPEETQINAVLSLGGGLAYRFTNNLGVHAEIEYNLVTSHESYYFFYGGRSYFPMRVGVIYVFY